jgi:hypothetical protein
MNKTHYLAMLAAFAVGILVGIAQQRYPTLELRSTIVDVPVTIETKHFTVDNYGPTEEGAAASTPCLEEQNAVDAMGSDEWLVASIGASGDKMFASLYRTPASVETPGAFGYKPLCVILPAAFSIPSKVHLQDGKLAVAN